MSNTQENIKLYTVSDIQSWDGMWEIIHGVPFCMSPSPTYEHQLISKRIESQLDFLLKDCKECFSLYALEWKIDEKTSVIPDNIIFCGEVKTQFLSSSPAVVFEILSKSTAKRDRFDKFGLYEIQRVKYYCLIDPLYNTAEVFMLSGSTYDRIFFEETGVLNFDLGDCKIDFDFSKIWN